MKIVKNHPVIPKDFPKFDITYWLPMLCGGLNLEDLSIINFNWLRFSCFVQRTKLRLTDVKGLSSKVNHHHRKALVLTSMLL